MPGRHNLLNAAGAILSCLEWGVSFEKLKSALASFKGVKRRFDIHHNDGQRVYVDDYAHHPNEIKVLYEGLREFYPEHKLIGVFQPHLYSRTRDFLLEFQTVLSEFDTLFVMPIYPARELPIEGINAEALLEGIEVDKKSLLVLGSSAKNVYLSARNLKGAEVVNDAELSTYKIVNAQHLILAESAVNSINSNLNTK